MEEIVGINKSQVLAIMAAIVYTSLVKVQDPAGKAVRIAEGIMELADKKIKEKSS